MSNEKAARYVAQLYAARCNSQWQSVFELARKVEKHAPARKCLTLASRFSAGLRLDPQNFLASPAAQQYLDPLTAAIKEEEGNELEAFEATTCRALLISASGSSGNALNILEGLSKHLVPASPKLDNDLDIWTAVCALNGNNAKATVQEALDDVAGASKTYTDRLPYVSELLSRSPKSSELQRSIEQFLSNACLLLSNSNADGTSNSASLMTAFHLLSRAPPTGNANVPRRRILRLHYAAISKLVADGTIYSPSQFQQRHDIAPAQCATLSLQQYREVTQIETEYEKLLLRRTRFPKADETNLEVKSWIDLVMGNWRVFCGSDWSDNELGKEGKRGVGRRTLDILYRAASKTFHSTQILRYLFTVHAFLGEFDLAFKAFDSYVEIITKGKARIEKSGETSSDLDDDETSLLFAVEAIKVSCRYGSIVAAEKALEIATMMEKWLRRGESGSSEKVVNDGGTEPTDAQPKQFSAVSSHVLASVYRAIGISQAQWSRFTYDVLLRDELHQKAIKTLERALSFVSGPTENLETLFALALVLGETRDISKGIEVIKPALRAPTSVSPAATTNGDVSETRDRETSYHSLRERNLLPVWHLLSLLLTTREEFAVAERTCEAAFSQFKDPVYLFGDYARQQATPTPHSRKLSATLLDEKHSSKESTGLVDRMSYFEKQYILDIKMTQMSILEIEDGPEVAVNTGHELLALYARLFGASHVAESQPPSTAQSTVPPPSSSSVVRGRFGKPKATGALDTQPERPITSRPGTTTTTAPTINVTNENGNTSETATPNHTGEKQTSDRHHLGLRKSPSGRLQKPREGTTSRPATAQDPEKHSVESQKLTDAKDRRSLERPIAAPEKSPTPSHQLSTENPNWPLGPRSAEATSQSPRIPDQHQHPRAEAPQAKNPAMQSASTHERPSATSIIITPEPCFTHHQYLRLRTSSLVKIWLFIAGLYCRASLFEDGKEAVAEAQTLVANLELEIAKDSSSIKAFQENAWGSGRSLEDLWADVYAERGNLLHAESLPHDAMANFEKALSHSPDHLQATIGLSKILLDIYCELIPPEKPDTTVASNALRTKARQSITVTRPSTEFDEPADSSRQADLSPPERNRLAARDRACGLLSAVTKLGVGWDSSEAWYVLARAYEESGQTEKAREALWWTVELEDTKPLRHWRDVNPGGYVLL